MRKQGEHVSFANCGLPYHIAGEIGNRADLLVQTAEGLRKRFRLDVRPLHEVLSIDRTRKVVRVKDLSTNREFEQAYDALVLSPGAAPIRPGVPGSFLPCVHTLRNLADMDRIKGAVDSKSRGHALLVGGGFIGLEMAEALRHRGWSVLLVEKSPQILSPADPEMAVLVARELRRNDVEVLTDSDYRGTTLSRDGRVVADLGGRHEIVDLVILAIGVRPETGLAKAAGLELGERGGIKVDVRTALEFSEGAIPGAVNIPVDSLRQRLGELPRDRELLVYCRVGLRGYLATRILAQSGFKVRNLSGGWLTWETWKEVQAA